MDDIFEDDSDIYMEPIKKKPKTQEIEKSKTHQQIQKHKQPSIPLKHVRDLKTQESLLESLKFTERIHPDTMQSSLKSDYTEWTHSNFVFPLKLTPTTIDPDFQERLGQYYKDFNSKCKIYPYPHFVDLKPDSDYIITTTPPTWPIEEEEEEGQVPEIIPLKEKETGIKKPTKVQIKIEPK